jgi:hypothetical protein
MFEESSNRRNFLRNSEKLGNAKRESSSLRKKRAHGGIGYALHRGENNRRNSVFNATAPRIGFSGGFGLKHYSFLQF